MKKTNTLKYLLLGLVTTLVACNSNNTDSTSNPFDTSFNSELSTPNSSDANNDSSNIINNSSSNNESSNNTSSDNTQTTDKYFSIEHADLLNSYFNFKVPFVNTSNYTFEDYTTDNANVPYVKIYFDNATQANYTNITSEMNSNFNYVYTNDYDYRCYLSAGDQFALEIGYVDYDEEYDPYIELTVYNPYGLEITNKQLNTADQNTLNQLLGTNMPVVGSYYELYDYSDSYSASYYVLYYNDITQDQYYDLLDACESVFNNVGTDTDENGTLWDCYEANSMCLDLSFVDSDQYYYPFAEIHIYDSSLQEDGGNSGSGDGSGSGSDEEVNTKYFVNGTFDASDTQLLNSYFNFQIPTVGDQYAIVDESTTVADVYLHYYGVSQSDFNTFLDALDSKFTYDGEYEDSGDLIYCYSYGDYYIDTLYDSSYEYVYFNIYHYSLAEGEDSGDDNTGSGGNSGSGSNVSELITNNGKGLPQGTNGIYNIDFAANDVKVKNVNGLGDYYYGCPTTGSPKVLVVPVQFIDVTATSKGYTIDAIKDAFLPKSETNANLDYYSVYDYFYISSYGQLTLDIEILDTWFTPENNSTYYKNKTIDYYDSNEEFGEQYIMDEVLQYLDNQGYDLSEYDTNNDECIDSIVLINTLDIDDSTNFNWAFRFWNILTDSNNEYYYYDGVSANDYLWASYQFLFESEYGYDNPYPTNTYTFIHELSHVLGSDDYYNTYNTNDSPLEGYDVMDSSIADHNPFTKFHLGWLTTSKLIVADKSITVDLNAFEENGDTLIIANNFDPTLGLYQEYWIVVYYNNTSLNGGNYGLFEESGIVVYHINASLMIDYNYSSEDFDYYFIYNTNTSPEDQEYGTEDNLIDFVKNGNDYVYGVNDSLSANTTDDSGNKISYTFKVDSLTNEKATLTFTSTKSSGSGNSTDVDNSGGLGWL